MPLPQQHLPLLMRDRNQRLRCTHGAEDTTAGMKLRSSHHSRSPTLQRSRPLQKRPLPYSAVVCVNAAERFGVAPPFRASVAVRVVSTASFSDPFFYGRLRLFRRASKPTGTRRIRRTSGTAQLAAWDTRKCRLSDATILPPMAHHGKKNATQGADPRVASPASRKPYGTPKRHDPTKPSGHARREMTQIAKKRAGPGGVPPEAGGSVAARGGRAPSDGDRRTDPAVSNYYLLRFGARRKSLALESPCFQPQSVVIGDII